MAELSNFWEKPLNQLTNDQWESLCDGCAKCCYIYVHADKERSIKPCKMLDEETKRCKAYSLRTGIDFGGYHCQSITFELLASGILPETCAYVRKYKGEDLEDWQIEKARKNYGNTDNG